MIGSPPTALLVDRSAAICLYWLNLKLNNKAENRSSTPPAELREPGKVRAGAGAGAEWTWEPPTESLVARLRAVGLDGEGTVIRARGIKRKPYMDFFVPDREVGEQTFS